MFELTKPQKEIRKAAKDFAKGEFDKELACELEKRCEFPKKIWKKAADLGFIGIHFPEKYSGGQMGMLESVLITEEFCRSDSSIGCAITQASFASECILKFGSEDLKNEFLPKVAEGKIISGAALTETKRGSDYKNINTTAVKSEGEWVINGNKTYVVNGGVAGFYVVLCKTGSDDVPIEKQLTMFAVEADRGGLTTENVGKKLGNNMVATSSMVLKDVTVPDSNMIGKEGKGYAQLNTFQDENRILVAAQALGNALGSYDRMMEYVKGREQFGKKLAEFQVSRHKIADMATKIELSKLILYKTAWSRDQGNLDRKLSSMAKMTASRTAMEVGAQTIQLYGGYGYMMEYEIERYYRDAKVIEIQEGARDVQKDIIADAVIGKIK